eukprot:CAMPEP_0172310684 /NCGR_PEP_ID=MMETSP1058-20130122/12437_1 /TAXON_ID=83371 /ORGANISM="Detonula confervacea, Strain CCMP 353" /LENGTH=66 /DNA_ID=CAMNT_0013023593 /DNA_START=44 /DNA_END=240 /DNA_ORIENTATION=+
MPVAKRQLTPKKHQYPLEQNKSPDEDNVREQWETGKSLYPLLPCIWTTWEMCQGSSDENRCPRQTL